MEASRHAQIISTVYVITYLGSAFPVIGLGLDGGIGLEAAVAAFVTCSAPARQGLLAASHTGARSLRPASGKAAGLTAEGSGRESNTPS